MAGMSAADQKFLSAMIEHHQAALTMSQQYLDKTSPRLRQARIAELARAIITAQTGEIAKMQSWLKQAGVTPTSGGMDM
jgi:uncharacterized protein (DUF305 family)